MPTYCYSCNNCGYEEEVFGLYSKCKKKIKCPSCGKVDSFIRCIGTGSGIVFKGTGFYETDYKNKDYYEYS